MQKRPWEDIYDDGGGPSPSSSRDLDQRPRFHRASNTRSAYESPRAQAIIDEETENHGSDDQIVPTLSRKIKACAACRKHKIKCLMDEGGLPCRRCAKHQLECVVSKNLQTIIDEKAQYTDAIFNDLDHIYTILRELAQKAGLPDPHLLRTTVLRKPVQQYQANNASPLTLHESRDISERHLVEPQRHDFGPSRDKSPEIPAEEDTSLPHVPIQSLYALTKWKSLRPPGVFEDLPSPSVTGDFIGRGEINEEDAERLFATYRDRLDAFIYEIGCPYQTLGETRTKSPILATTLLAVAALHDQGSNDIYSACSAELRRLFSLAIFDRCTSRDYLRAMCVASYWLSDISWIVSGHAIRRASECALHNQHNQAVQGQSHEAADGARIWFILRICDQRLATLYGRPAIVNEDASVQEIEDFLQSPVSNDQDKRLMGQLALLSIFKSMRELFGPDNGQAIQRAYLHQITHFNKQLDDWLTYWSAMVSESYRSIGGFPRKAVRLHFQFAKLHLNSHVFRGLSAGQPIPHYFLDCAATAIRAATSTIDFILSDSDVADVVVGIPSYLHCMTAFACMFLIKVALKYGADLIEPDYVWDLTTRLVQYFRSVPAGSWHLTKLMAPGLERMASMLDPTKAVGLSYSQALEFQELCAPRSSAREFDPNGSFVGFDGDFFFDYNISLGMSPIFPLEFGIAPADGQSMI